jgi:hypothetical protein
LKNNNAPFKRVNKKDNTQELASSVSVLESTIFSTDIKGDILDGFASTDGSWQGSSGGTNWYSFRIKVKENKTFIMEHETLDSFSVRLVTLDANGVLISRVMINNGEFTVPDNCAEFVLNFPTPNSAPTLPIGATLFTDRNQVGQLKITVKGSDMVSKIEKLSKEVLEIPVVDYYVETEIPYTLEDNAYYSSSSGAYMTGTNWYTTKFDAYLMQSIKLKHADSTTVRIVFYVNNNFHSASVVSTNTEIPLPENCSSVALNFPLANSAPDVTQITDYESKAKIQEIKIYGNKPVYKNETVTQRLNAIAKNTPKTVKILSIGNSFSEDAQTMLYDIAKSAGIELVLGNLYMGGQSLQGHWAQVTGNLSGYSYQKRSSTGRKDTANTSMKTGIQDEAWDIITFQQASETSGDYTTFQPYLNNLIDYVKGLATNANVKYAFHMTWAYASTSTHSGYDKYDSNQLTMYTAITDAYLKAMQETNISILIPNGTAIQNARSSSYLKAMGTELTRDGHHMDLGIGRYIVGLGMFEALLAGTYKKDILADVTYVPTNNGATPFLGYLAKVAVKNANINPFKITAI